MKKRVLMLVMTFLLCVGSAFSEKLMTFGVGLGYPNYNIKVEGDDFKLSAVDLDLNFFYVKKETGLTFKFDWDNGVGWTDEIEKDTSVGYDMRLSGGIGWRPIRTDKYIVSIVGVFGGGFTYFSTDSDTGEDTRYAGTYMIRRTEKKEQWSFFEANVGLEVCGQIRLGDMFGLYAIAGMRNIFAGRFNSRADGSNYYGYYYAAYKKSFSKHDAYSFSGNMSPEFSIGISMFLN